MTQLSHKEDWLQVDQGVEGLRFELTNESSGSLTLNRKDILWITALDGELQYSTSVHGSPGMLGQGNSILILWPREDWNIIFNTSTNCSLAAFKISLDALHRILAVDFQQSEDSSKNVDFKNFSKIVHLSPVIVRNLERLFIQTEHSMFKVVARRGMFLNAFAEMMEMLYGNDMDQCPFHIDADTERRIRNAHQILVKQLDVQPDLHALALEVELPKAVLKEGFYYVYGKSINDYIQDYKFEKAATMLESGKYLIKEVAFSIGYQNPSHFISAFKQRFGETPKQWVKQFYVQNQA